MTRKRNADGSETFKVNAAEHQHINDVRDKLVKEPVTEAKKAAKSTNKNPRLLLAESLAGAPTEILAQMPNANAFSKAMRNERKGNLPKAPKNLNDLVLTDVRTTSGANFLFHDNGPNEKERIIIFATEQALKFLAKCDHWFMDGTVSSAPALFSQVYSIHGNCKGWREALVFIACTNKTAGTYKYVFDKLKEKQPTLSPNQINVDCELAAINAAQSAFPHTKVQLCWFHIKQSVIRNLGTNNLKMRYESDSVFANEVRQMISVAFLPVEHVAATWDTFIANSTTLNKAEQEKDRNIKYFVNDYFAKNYVGEMKANGQRKKPRFPIEQWNVHESTMNGEYLFLF